MSSWLGTTAKPPAPPKAFDSEPASTTWEGASAERFERVPGTERTLDRDPWASSTYRWPPNGRWCSASKPRRSGRPSSRHRRPARWACGGGRDLADRCRQRCGITMSKRRVGPICSSTPRITWIEACAVFRRGTRHLRRPRIAGQGAGAEQRQQAQWTLLTEVKAATCAPLYMTDSRPQLAEVGRPSPVADVEKCSPNCSSLDRAPRSDRGVSQGRDTSRDELHGLAAVGQVDRCCHFRAG
jgi:hypothetical protein